jgi:flagellar biosynthesis/type III secretory pathway M-ring protein FliF/YscJ
MDAMENLRRYLARIQAQLVGLTISQKLLIGLLIVVMIGTIFFTVTFSAKPEMVVLIPQAMTPEEVNRAEMFLKGKYDYTVSGDKIMVPAEKAYAIRGELFAAQALPKDTTVAFDQLVKANNPFMTDANSARQWNYATQETLTKMLKYFPYVQDGTVIISRGERAGIGRNAVPSSASVTVKVRNNEGLTSNQVVAIVDMIRGAVAGLQREDVHITDGQRVYHAPSSDTPMPSDLLQYKKSIEDDLTRKLYMMFDMNVKIAVNALPDLSVRERKTETFDPKVVKAVRKETSRETSTSDGVVGTSGEPGVKPNTAVTADQTASGGHRSTSTMTDSTADMEVRIGSTNERQMLPAGTEIKELTASISMPRSYFVAIFRRMAKDPKADPEDDTPLGKDPKVTFKTLVAEEIQKSRALAKNAIGAKSEDQIRVDWFDDTIALKPVEVAVAGSFSTGSIGGMLASHAKQVVLAVLALGVLGWMLMMVRRAVPAGAGADIDPSVFLGNGIASGRGGKSKGGNNQMDVTEDIFGEAGEGDAVLTGIELDDDTLQSRKMVDEVSTMIKENPENAAALVKRWMSKGK